MISDERLERITRLNDCYSPEEMKEMARELLALRKAFSGKPDSYVITGSRLYKDRPAVTMGIAESILNDRGDDGSRIEGLYRKPPTE